MLGSSPFQQAQLLVFKTDHNSVFAEVDAYGFCNLMSMFFQIEHFSTDCDHGQLRSDIFNHIHRVELSFSFLQTLQVH